MTWPHIIKLTATCPKCGKSTALEAIHQPFERVHGNRDRIYRSFTWADCPTCGNEWRVAASVAHRQLPAA